MKFAICIPTFGNSAARLKACIDSVLQFTIGIDFHIFVRDDATPNTEYSAWQDYVCQQYKGKVSFTKGLERRSGGHNLHELGEWAYNEGYDILTFLSDDCLVSQGWLYPIKHYFEWNEEAKIAMVSTPFIEAWEMVVAGRLPSEQHFLKWENDGTLLREHLTLTEAEFETKKRAGVISIDHFTPLGPMTAKGNFELKHPVPIDGGLGPCFSISAKAWIAVGGFENCFFIGDYEAMIGWKFWIEGWKCVMIPGPPVYHARGVASKELDSLTQAGIKIEQHDVHKPAGLESFKAMWFHAPEQVRTICKPQMDKATVSLQQSRFIKYQAQTFPINVSYNKLTEINLGPIHWRDQRQQERMNWIGEHCLGNVLDIGCANGGLRDFIKSEGSYTGVDLDRVRIDEAKAKYPNDTFFVMDASYGLPFEKRSFDTVVCADCLEHLPQAKAQQVIHWISAVTDKVILLTLPISEATVPNVDHIWAPSKDTIQSFLEAIPGERRSLLEEWTVQVTFVEDFALIRLEPKYV
jgi:SAM-dependent methyltransferase/GT2 family glycosyltransferase